MADRRVTMTGKDDSGDITKLCGSWGERLKADAIVDIDFRAHTYFVQEPGTNRVEVIVVNDNPRYLRTDPNGSAGDNLDNLPNC